MSATTATIAVAGSGRSKFPFTTTQWQELEHQALIYKYMAAGIPIPPDLLFSIKRSLDSSLSSKLFPYQSTPLGWNPYQMGYGKKIDPEPGRCRRTDGKKWRCSKEAYPDSKYCERHMHRGKNRSRKPVESPLTNNNIINNNNNNNTCSTSTISPIISASAATTTSPNPTVSSTNFTNQSLPNNKPSSNSLYSFPSSDSFYNSTNANLLYPNASSYSQKDYRDRYYQGLKEEVGEHAFFTESSGSSIRGFSGSTMDESWQLGEKQSGVYTNNYSNNQYNGSSTRQQQEQEQQEKQCYIWGRDFNCELSMKVDEERSNNLNEKTTHHFFDEWPIKTGGGGGLRDDSSSTTQLSISIPSSASNHHDFFLSHSRNP
ncbi:uncharacterized protein LOC141592521 [Silene latifolia]|uniref:uncharacterized protein LOC141592521 n=1 Tax=Silene latifolia TaxID=37657 RepID=UPI003D788EFB